MSSVGTAVVANGSFGSHPDEKYDANRVKCFYSNLEVRRYDDNSIMYLNSASS